jgi:hypothetical protein
VIPLKVGKLSVKDQVVNILGFGTLWSLSSLYEQYINRYGCVHTNFIKTNQPARFGLWAMVSQPLVYIENPSNE